MKELAEKINHKLDILIKLMAMGFIQSGSLLEKTQRDKIFALFNLGLDKELIAGTLNTTTETVRVTLQKSKKVKTKKGPKGEREVANNDSGNV